MSHFSVLVIGPDVEAQLAPYHEFECTGTNDQYIQDINETESDRAEYEKYTTDMIKTPTGELVSRWTEAGEAKAEFYRDPTPEELQEIGPLGGSAGSTANFSYTSRDWGDGLGYRARIYSLPGGYEEIMLPTKDVKTFAQWITYYHGRKVVPFGQEPDLEGDHKYGYVLVDENGDVTASINRTNPNAHWDWYQIGGRWNGFLKLKVPSLVSQVGDPGIQNMNADYEHPGNDRADFCTKDDIDIEGMRAEAEEKARKHWLGGPIKNTSGTNRKTSRRRWSNTSNGHVGGAFRTFAVVKDGQWYEKGSMGWWGCVSNEKDTDEWSRQFAELVDGLPGDTMLTIVDCHI